MQSIRFSRLEMLFSLKSFAGAMLALYLASRAGLPRPFWAFMTAYIVAHPLAGNVRSKALYRFVGTLLGCAATVVLIPALSAAPELLTLALALWTGLCLYLSLLDRSARSYVFLLAGYSAALIGFPLVEAPAAMFDTAVARVQEIGLGILCASLVHSLVLPASLAPSLLALIDRALGDARRWMSDLLGDGLAHADGARMAADRQRLALDITQLRLLSTHVPFDTGNLRWTAGAIRAMQDRLSALTPTLSAIEDRLEALKVAEGKVPADIASALGRHMGWIAPQEASLPATATAAAIDEARVAFRALADGPASSPWIRALRIDLAVRLEELVREWAACIGLRTDIDAGLAGSAMPRQRAAALGQKVLHRDRGLALRSAATAVLATCACCAVWIATAWPSGSAAAMSAAVFCSFFATMDDPVPAMHKFVAALLWSLPVSVFCVLVVMPLARDFGMLALCIAPFFLLVGCYIARPASSLAALGMFFGVAGTLALQDTANADLPSLLNSNLALILGAVAAARITALVRSVGSDWSARRIRRATSLDLAELASRPQDASARDAYAGRMLDRIALLAPRTAPGAGEEARADALLALRDLRMGADIATLQQWRRSLPAEAVGRLLADSARAFRAQAAGAPRRDEPLLPQIDRLLLDAVHGDPAQPDSAAIAALVGFRRNLFPAAHGALHP
ncbi:FUSC family protein [Variovorax paradoxus]|uniref:FUSC family protein n=1 Tax=Variovorax paradoxus TaxID=34073 RepID=UPI0024785499